MDNVTECVIEWLKGEERVGVTMAGGEKLCNKVKKLAISHPDEVEVISYNRDGSVYAYVPRSWVKIAPPIKRIMSEEQKAKYSARMKALRKEQLSKNNS